jgi:tetratricopeptide (TPR) repeat protein
LAANEATIRAYEDSTDEAVRAHIAWAMVNKGFDLESLGRSGEAIATYKSLCEYVPFSGQFASAVAQGLMNWALTLDELGLHGEESEIYARIRIALQDVEDESVAHLLAWALLNNAVVLFDERRYDGAIELSQAVVDRWGGKEVWSLPKLMHEALARAFRQKAQAEAALGQFDAAVEDADEAVRRFFGADDPGTAEEVAWALLVKGGSREAMGQTQPALETYNRIVERYGRLRSAKVRAVVASAKRMREGLETP